MQKQADIPAVQPIIPVPSQSNNFYASPKTEITVTADIEAVISNDPSTENRPSFKVSNTEEEAEDSIVELVPLAEGKVWSKKGKQVRLGYFL